MDSLQAMEQQRAKREVRAAIAKAEAEQRANELKWKAEQRMQELENRRWKKRLTEIALFV